MDFDGSFLDVNVKIYLLIEMKISISFLYYICNLIKQNDNGKFHLGNNINFSYSVFFFVGLIYVYIDDKKTTFNLNKD